MHKLNNNNTEHFSIVILISGNGSNLQAIIDAIKEDNLPIKIKAVISNEKDAYGLIRAKNNNLNTHVVCHRDYPSREKFEEALLKHVQFYNPSLIVLAGFMRVLSNFFIKHYPFQIVNIHPALLPKFKGLNTHQRVLEAKELEHGVTIHWVTEELDAGPILAQTRILLDVNETIETLQSKVQQEEHFLYPKVIADIARGKYHEYAMQSN